MRNKNEGFAQQDGALPMTVQKNQGPVTRSVARALSILQAFDRLEVSEFSAKSLIDIASKLGEWTPLGERDVQDLEEAFGLESRP